MNLEAAIFVIGQRIDTLTAEMEEGENEVAWYELCLCSVVGGMWKSHIQYVTFHGDAQTVTPTHSSEAFPTIDLAIIDLASKA